MHYKTCEICGIRSGRSDGQKRIFMAKFPLDEDRCKQWVRVTGKEDLVYIPIEKLHQLKHICGRHFLSKDFKKKKTQLRKNATPSVGLTLEPLANELFIGFPLHIAKTEQTELSSIISMEHNYCFSWTGIPRVSISEDTQDMDFELDENKTTDLVTKESLAEVPDVAGPFTWQNPSEVIDSDDENDAQYIDTNTMTDDVLLYNDDKPSTINTCEITNQDVSTNEKQLQYHKEYKCNHCSGPIAGFRYRCVQCADYDLCAACEALGAHEHHYVLRIPGPRSNAEIDSVLERIRNELMAMNNSVLLEDTHMLDSMKEEIKDELDDPLSEKETRESYEAERMAHMSTTYQSGDSNGLDDDQSDNDQSDDDQSDNDQSDSEQTESDTDKEYIVEDNEDTTSEIPNCNHINKRASRGGLKSSESPKRTLTTSPTKQTISNVGSIQQRRYTNRKFNSTRYSYITSKLGDTNVITIKHNHTGSLK